MLFRSMLNKHWSPILVAAEISFIKAIKPLHKFELVTQVLCWDETYLYLEQRFEQDGKLKALAYVKGLFVTKGKKVSTEELLTVAGFANAVAPAMPDAIKSWKEMTEIKKSTS